MAAADAQAAILQRYGLAGQTALVTGGTKGIGAAVVEELCALGAKVCAAHMLSSRHRQTQQKPLLPAAGFHLLAQAGRD